MKKPKKWEWWSCNMCGRVRRVPHLTVNLTCVCMRDACCWTIHYSDPILKTEPSH